MKPGNLRRKRKVLNPAVVYRKMRVQPETTLRRPAGRFCAPQEKERRKNYGKATFYIRIRH